MTYCESTCPYCGENTSGSLPLDNKYPCDKCIKKYYHIIDGILIKKKYDTIEKHFKREPIKFKGY